MTKQKISRKGERYGNAACSKQVNWPGLRVDRCVQGSGDRDLEEQERNREPAVRQDQGY